MSFSAGSIKAKMVLDKSQFEKSARDVNNATKKVAGQAKKTGTAMKGMWKQMAIGLGVTGGITMVVRGLVRQMSDTIKVGRSFEKEWANVTTMLDISRSATEKMKHELRMLSPTLGDTTDLAKGMYQVLSASIEPAKAIKFLGEAAKSAKAGVTDTKTAVDALTTVINAYGMEAEDVTGISDIMFATVKRGKLTYAELATSLGTVVPVAATVGVEFKEIAAATATLTRQGINAGKATMQLRQVMMAVLKPSEEAIETAARLGIEFTSTALKAKGLSKFLFDVKEKTKGSSDDMAKLVPNVRALTAVMALAGEQAGELAYDVEFMGDAVGLTDEAFMKQTDSIDFWLETFEVAADKIKIAAYEGLISPLRESIRTAEDFEEKVTAATNRTANDISLHMSGVAEEISWLAKAWKKTDKFLFGWSDSVHKMLDSTNSLSKAQEKLAIALSRAGREAVVKTDAIKPLSEETKTLAERAHDVVERWKELSAFKIDWEALKPPSELMARWDEFYNLVETPELDLAFEQFAISSEDNFARVMESMGFFVADSQAKGQQYGEILKGMTEFQQEWATIAIGEFMMMEASIKGFVGAILGTFEKWAIGQIIPKIMAALPFPVNLLATGGAIAAIKMIFKKISSMEEGGVTQEEGIYHLHPREMVLPIEKAPALIKEISNETIGGSAKVDFNFYAPIISTTGIASADLDRVSEELFRKMETEARRRGYSLNGS